VCARQSKSLAKGQADRQPDIRPGNKGTERERVERCQTVHPPIQSARRPRIDGNSQPLISGEAEVRARERAPARRLSLSLSLFCSVLFSLLHLTHTHTHPRHLTQKTHPWAHHRGPNRTATFDRPGLSSALSRQSQPAHAAPCSREMGIASTEHRDLRPPGCSPVGCARPGSLRNRGRDTLISLSLSASFSFCSCCCCSQSSHVPGRTHCYQAAQHIHGCLSV
jgi:hypothetical protein